jgi:acylphosphatase
MTTIARHVTIRGRVQGVFYRGWTVETARALGLDGWVRNRANGDVEMLLQGDQAAVDQLIALAWEGPPAARVDDVRAGPATIGDLRGFEQRTTL